MYILRNRNKDIRNEKLGNSIWKALCCKKIFSHQCVCVFFFFCFRERVDWDANVDSLDREEVLLNIF